MNSKDCEAFERWRRHSIWDRPTEFIDVACQAFKAALAHRDTELAEVTQQRDELVEAVKEWDKITWRGFATDMSEPQERAVTLADRIQSTQPQGEWIDIEPDGSNLPERVKNGHWFVYFCSGYAGWTTCVPSLRIVPDKVNSHAVAYWSLPHIDRRPTIPEYKPNKVQND